MTKINYPHVLSRLCAPLAIEQRGFNSVLAFLGPRMGIDFQVQEGTVAALQEAANSARNFADVPDNIAVVDVCGPLVRRAGGMDALCGMTSYQQIEDDFMDAITDPSKQAVLMMFDSPGGEVGGLFDLADLIQGQRGQKPIYAAVSESAFSAAYALASACDRIFLTRTAGVGSIGVFTMHVDMSGMDKQEGLKFTYIYAGAKKVEGNPHEPLSEDAQTTIQTEVDRSYKLFVDTVARNRQMSAQKIRNTEAGLKFGQDAVDIGLADEVGTISDVVASLQRAISTKYSSSLAAEVPAETISLSASSESADIPDPGQEHTSPVAAKAANPTKETPIMATEQQDAATLPTPQKAKSMEDECGKKKGKPADEEMDPNEAEPDDDEDDKKKAAADPSEVAFLCEVAKRPDLLMGFIKNKTPLAQVRKELISAQATEQQAPGAIGHHVSLTGPNQVDQLDSLAKSRAAATGKSYSAAYGEVLRENPTLYTGYLDRKDAALNGRK